MNNHLQKLHPLQNLQHDVLPMLRISEYLAIYRIVHLWKDDHVYECQNSVYATKIYAQPFLPYCIQCLITL